jgi:glycosyltransferase involved in cell wall biosynthesis
MRRACVLAVPSTTGAGGDAEGLPNVVVEAAASGLPVVATHHAGIPEAVVNGVTGLLVPERDLGALAQGLAALLRNSDRRNRMAEAARHRAASKFDAAKQMERLESCYDRLAAR